MSSKTQTIALTVEQRKSFQTVLDTSRAPLSKISASKPKKKRCTPSSSTTKHYDASKQPKRWTYETIEPKIRQAMGQHIVQKDYSPHPIHYTDDQMGDLFRKLFEDLVKFSDKYFTETETQLPLNAPWRDIPDVFVEYTELVAEAGHTKTDSWNRFLTDPTLRKWLVISILVAIFQKYIFDELLFGGHEEEKKLLFGIDRALFTSEGFTRNALRSQSVRTFLGGSPITRDFWSEVGKLSEQISIILNPLLDQVCDVNDQAGFTQKLHNLISDTAYIHLAIRTCSDIIWISATQPGTPYNADDHTVIENDIYHESKRVVTAEYATLEPMWQAEITAHVKTTNPHATSDDDDDDGHNKDDKSEPRVYCRPLTKMCVWPMIQRFKPGGWTPEDSTRGFRVYDIGNTATILYFAPGDRRIKKPLLKDLPALKKRATPDTRQSHRSRLQR